MATSISAGSLTVWPSANRTLPCAEDSAPPLAGVTATFEWSTDFLSWHTTGQSDGVNTVTLEDSVYEDDTISPIVTHQVTATVTIGTPAKLFVRVGARN